MEKNPTNLKEYLKEAILVPRSLAWWHKLGTFDREIKHLVG